MKGSLLVILSIALLSACGDTANVRYDAGDVLPDQTDEDVIPDTSPDPGPDTAPDTVMDTVTDTGADTAADPHPDADATDVVCPPDPTPPGSSSCPDECTGGCEGGVCTIDCSGASTCDSVGTITCPPDYACTVICDGVDACDTDVIDCPMLYACTLRCEGGMDACGDVLLDCGQASCTLECGTPGSACTGTVLGCGTGECTATCMGTVAPTVHCNGSCDCNEC